jgi:tetratricopeptide (TPR) repeat protein
VLIEDFTKTIELDPKYAYAYNNRAAAKFKIKDYNGAIEDCNKAIQMDPNYGFAYLNRGNAKEMMRDEAGACEDWKKAAQLGVESAKSNIGDCN